MRRPLIFVTSLAATLCLAAAALAQTPSDQELEAFTGIFLELQENARPLQARGGDAPPDAWRERRESIDIIEEHGWTLERYNDVAHAVNSNSEVFRRFRSIVEQHSCAGLLQSPPTDCD